MNFNYHLPVNIIFGNDRVSEVGEIAACYGSKALIVTGKNSTKKSGVLKIVADSLKNAGIDSEVFDSVSANPLTSTVTEGVAYAKYYDCNIIIGLGGGSVMDCAKAIAFFSVNFGDINDYIFNKKIGDEALPLVLIPTTCGTGSEVNGFSVLTNPDTMDKKSLRTDAIIAKASIIDPNLMKTMPKNTLASVGFDALCHSMEAFLSKRSQPLTDIMCINAIKMIANSLPVIYNGAVTDEDWNNLTLSSSIGGMVIHTAGVILPHGMEHPVSGLKNIAHGKGLAALTPIITEASIPYAREKYSIISKCLGGNDANDCVASLNKLLKEIDLNLTLGSLGIIKSDIEWLTENCFKVSVASIANHPNIFSKEEIRDLYLKAL